MFLIHGLKMLLPNNLKIVNGNILNYDCDLIVQQCNCLTIHSHGLSLDISMEFPGVNFYSSRRQVGRRNLAIPEDRDIPGTCKILNNVCAIFGQWRPGKLYSRYWSNYPESDPSETKTSREEWFISGLIDLENKLKQFNKTETNKYHTMAFPYRIGCGLAGGDWNRYYKMIQIFALRNPDLKVDIVKL